MAGFVSGVIFEYRRDDGNWSPYSPDVSAELELAYVKRSRTCSLKGGKYIVDFTNLTQTRISTGTQRPIQHTQITLPSSPDIMGYWEWEDIPRHFTPYAINATVEIELAFMKRLSQIDLASTPACIPYSIDMVAMEQTRHGYNTKRTIKRVSLLEPLQRYLQDYGGSSTGTTSTAKFFNPASSFLSSTSPSTSPMKGKTSAPLSLSASSYMTSTSSSPVKGNGKSTRSKKKSSKTLSAGSTKPSSSSSSTSTVKVSKSKSSHKSLTEQYMGTEAQSKSTETFRKFAKTVKSLNFGQDGPCPICMSQLSEFSGFEEDLGIPTPSSSSLSQPPSPDLCKLRKCGHLLHRACLLMYMKNSSNSGLMCPTCKKMHGVRTGDMPDGTMSVSTKLYSVSGYEGYGTIEITYNFTAGIHNGVRYKANGFPRVCFLPDSPKGRKASTACQEQLLVLDLLRIAWKRRLTFTIGTSVTTGANNTIVWNEIHHKTEAGNNYTGHGYPDDNYLDNVLAELAAQGVEEEEEEDEEKSSSDSDL